MTRITLIVTTAAVIAAVTFAGFAVTSFAANKPVHGKGRLLAPMLVFAKPSKKNKKADVVFYYVFFRTAAGFAGPGHAAGTMEVDDAFSGESDAVSHLGGGKPSGRCYGWTVATTRKASPKLTRKEVGDTVKVRFRAYHTALQVRKVTMRAWPTNSGSDPALKKAFTKIGC